MFEEMDCRRSRRVLLEGWGQFDEPADRIVSIGAFEHFGHERYAAVSPNAEPKCPIWNVVTDPGPQSICLLNA